MYLSTCVHTGEFDLHNHAMVTGEAARNCREDFDFVAHSKRQGVRVILGTDKCSPLKVSVVLLKRGRRFKLRSHRDFLLVESSSSLLW